MATVRFKINSPRPGYTGEGAGGVWFREGSGELAVDLDNWENGNARGALYHFQNNGFGIEPLDGVTAEQALRDPAQDALVVQRELAELDRQIAAETSRDDLAAKRQQLADLRAKRAEEAKSEAAGEEGDKAPAPPLTTDVVPPSPDAPVADWRAYAVEIDPSLDDKAAKGLTRDALIAAYGSAYAAQEGVVTA